MRLKEEPDSCAQDQSVILCTLFLGKRSDTAGFMTEYSGAEDFEFNFTNVKQ